MKVSDEQLDHFISEITDDAMMGTSNAKEVMHLLLELKAIRQAATAGVEEAIQRITLSLYGEFIETPCIDPSVPSAVASVKSLNRHRRKVYDANVSVLRETLAAELTALLAERDAALNEIAVVWSRVALLSSQIPPKVFEELNAAAQIVERVRTTGELQPTIAECRAVLGKVEEMLRANKDGWITAYVNADGKSFLVDFSTCCDDEEEDTASTKEGKTLLDALAALVDGKEGG